MENYIAAGLDPARFWQITPRLYQTEMNGAARRAEIARSHVWWGAMLPHVKDPPGFREFVGGRSAPRAQTAEELQAMCDALAAAWGAERIDDGS